MTLITKKTHRDEYIKIYDALVLEFGNRLHEVSAVHRSQDGGYIAFVCFYIHNIPYYHDIRLKANAEIWDSCEMKKERYQYEVNEIYGGIE